MTRQSVESFLASNGWRIAGLIIAGTVAYVALTASVDSKLPRVEFEAYRSEQTLKDSLLLREQRETRADVQAIVCHLEPTSIRCRR